MTHKGKTNWIDSSVWQRFTDIRPARSYRRHSIIYMQGEAPVFFYYLLKGRVRTFIASESGSEQTLTVYKTGDIFGEASFFDRLPRVSSAVTLEDCLIAAIDRESIVGEFAKDPKLALHMLEYLSRTVRMLSGHVDSFSFMPAHERVKTALLELCSGRLAVCTHEELGKAAGTSRVTVSRVLKRLSELGLIRTGYGQVEILDLPGLRNYTGP